MKSCRLLFESRFHGEGFNLPDSEMDEGDEADGDEEFVLEMVETEHSETERRFERAVCALSCSSRRRR